MTVFDFILLLDVEDDWITIYIKKDLFITLYEHNDYDDILNIPYDIRDMKISSFKKCSSNYYIYVED